MSRYISSSTFISVILASAWSTRAVCKDKIFISRNILIVPVVCTAVFRAFALGRVTNPPSPKPYLLDQSKVMYDSNKPLAKLAPDNNPE